MLVAIEHKSVVAFPGVREDRAAFANSMFNNRFQRAETSGTICVKILPLRLRIPNTGILLLTERPMVALMVTTKIALVEFNFTSKLLHLLFFVSSNQFSEQSIITVYCVPVDLQQLSRLGSSEFKSKA
jgi:hypothetical protein